MNEHLLFSEKQRFTQWWLWLLILGLDGLFLFGFVQQVILGEPFGNKPMPDVGMIIGVALLLGFTLFFWSMKLETQVKEDGIYVRFFPIHRSYKRYTWDQLAKAQVREYAPLREYGGWGIRVGMSGRGKAYNVSGKKGLQLEFNTGKKILIGTQKGQELTKILEKLIHQSSFINQNS